MNKTDYEKFANFLKAAMEPYGRQITPSVIAVWIECLENYSFEAVRATLTEYLKSPAGKFAPLPAHVIEVLQSKDGHPGADEAWAMLPMTEGDTAVWTNEMSQAFFIALPLIESGDMVAARMAFRSAYERLVGESRRAGKPPEWSVTLGHDRHGRETALANAVLRGYITASRAAALVAPDVAERLLALKPPGTALQ